MAQIAALLQAIAWPAVTIYALVRYQTEIADLLKRIRRAAGVDIDPPTQEKPVDTPSLLPSTASDALPPLPKTASTIFWEDQIKRVPQFTTATPAAREEFLITLAARAILFNQFEQVEGSIWASQLRLLEHVNLHHDGVALLDLRHLFYDPAAAAFSPAFTNYSFEQYLTFLTSRAFIVIEDGRVTITDAGREYLTWRIEQRRPPKLAG
ncbi:MAG TPA: hypothetical protein VMW17_16605 [Candidatus Binatia bacterium]|nr:hypothetical protein [Candidatus Binatia bacterium]